MRETELDYVRRRASEETQKAHESWDGDIAAVHKELAIAYIRRVCELSDGPMFHLNLAA